MIEHGKICLNGEKMMQRQLQERFKRKRKGANTMLEHCSASSSPFECYLNI